MQVGQKVRLKEKCEFTREFDRHNPTNKTGVVVEVGNYKNDRTRTPDLPIVVDWGGFTNSYKFINLYYVEE